MISGFKAAGFPPRSAAGMTIFEAEIPIDHAAVWAKALGILP